MGKLKCFALHYSAVLIAVSRTFFFPLEELLTFIAPTPDTLKLLKELLKRQIKKELGAVNRDTKRLRDTLDENDSYKQKTPTMFINGKLSEEDKDAALSEANVKRANLQVGLMRLE